MKTKFQKELKSSPSVAIIPIFEDKKTPTAKKFSAYLKGFEAKFGNTREIVVKEKGVPPQMIFMGVGKSKSLTGAHTRNLGGKIGAYLKNNKHDEVSIVLNKSLRKFIFSLYEGILYSQY
ncbi:hypothetical protein GF354_01695, partial [Candidatus Peregrinibacteria bacterium]|nr:hypothetical protein [Candidatus Peregrinibacteria bacterium]